MDDVIKAAVIGVGAFGQNHARVINGLEDIDLVAVVDSDQVRGKEIASNLSTGYFSSIDAVINDIDAAIVATPTSTHFDIGSNLLEHSVHTFIEKPIASSSGEALKMVELAESKNLVLQVGHIERFNPAFLSVRAAITEPLYIEAMRISPYTERVRDSDVILDMMIHDIDIVLNLVKAPIKEIKAIGMKVLTDRIDMAQVRMEFKNRAVANISSSRISHSKCRKLRIFEKSKYFSIDFLSRCSYWAEVVIEDGKKKIKITEPESIHSEPLKLEIMEFFAAIRGQPNRGVNGKSAALALEVAESIIAGIRLS